MTTSKLSEQQKADAVSKIAAGANITQLADEFGVSRSTLYRARDQAATAEEFANQPKAPSYTEFGVTGLQRFGGTVREDYNRIWQNLQTMVPLVKEMLDHPIVGSTLYAVEAYLKNADWTVIPGGDSPADLAAAEFLEENMHGMSTSWTDFITQALSMLSFGFAPFEICYKRLDSGRIGWRKFAFRSQDTLAPGHEWEFDPNGGIKGMYQQAEWNKPEVFIPIEKMILLRTTAAKNNPQGRSLLRPAHMAWYYAKNLGEVEAISAERMGGGLPVIYLGSDSSKAGYNSDFALAKSIVGNVRSDEQSGIVFPRAKQGFAEKGKGILFELVSPPSKGAIDFDKMVQRYNLQISQTLLAQVIFLGGGANTGSNALAVELNRVFEQSLRGFLLNIVDTLNRFPVPRLFSFNTYDIGENYPTFSAQLPSNMSALELVTALTTAVSGTVLTKDESVETLVRKSLQLPPLLESEEAPAPDVEEAGADFTSDHVPAPTETNIHLHMPEQHAPDVKVDNTFQVPTVEQAPITIQVDAMLQAPDEIIETEVVTHRAEDGLLSRVVKTSRRLGKALGIKKFAVDPAQIDNRWEVSVSNLANKLDEHYQEFIKNLTERLANDDTRQARGTRGIVQPTGHEQRIVDSSLDELQKKVENTLGAGLAAAVPMIIGPDVTDLGAIDASMAEITEQQQYLETAFLPAVREKVMQWLKSPEGQSFEMGTLIVALGAFTSRLLSYAGSKMRLLNKITALQRDKAPDTRIYWQRDPAAISCPDCAKWSGKEYASYKDLISTTGGYEPGRCACMTKCRCSLLGPGADGGWIRD